ncbi:hypothetical protein Q765_00415 [Flavobacterium rivuli WB 3.3-2 = DSM 21788]|uniref:Uncharacterized protein n=1 Tax=Flavobacterium rivuli WB 3.3-2 = DSM 21788 TaxID=1121895 RepID=A0A0A2M6X4_9FLAO|nr:hypothetical protein [Flavobacterium rivuli]KGO88412.1 hypothetical protein Q765_00415 [Flavobacterium rivuli WB 3.3-2 = DSM 21788]
MKYAKQIQRLLNITEDQYTAEYLHRWTHWCIDQVKDYIVDPATCTPTAERLYHAELQKVMANTALTNYYSDQHDELEYQALAMLHPQVLTISIGQMREHYDIIMADIFKMYPKSLLNFAKKLTIDNPPYDHTAN